MFLVSLTCIALIVSGFCWYSFRSETHRNNQDVITGELLHINYGHVLIEAEIQATLSDVRLLALQSEFHEYLATNNEFHRKLLDRESRAVLEHRDRYTRIRYMDSQGLTVVDTADCHCPPSGHAPSPALKSQGQACKPIPDRPYQVYAEPNPRQDSEGAGESEAINLVFSSSIKDEHGKAKGFVQIFYSMHELTRRIRLALSREHSTSMLLAPDGRLLLISANQHNPTLLAEGSNDFVHRFTEAWKTMAASERGQFRTRDGLFTFATVHLARGGNGAFPLLPPHTGPEPDRAGYQFKLVAFVPHEQLSAYADRLLIGVFTPGGVLLVLLSLVAWIASARITRRKTQTAQLFAKAYFDELTGLPNRGLFFDRLRQAMSLARRYSQSFALLYIDLNDFKRVNDLYGHGTGDEVLRHVAVRLFSMLRDSDTAARLGGDEFVVILHQIKDRADAESVACKIARSITRPYYVGEHELQIGASVGVSLFPDDGDSQDDLLRSADMSMYADKGRRRGEASADCPDR